MTFLIGWCGEETGSASVCHISSKSLLRLRRSWRFNGFQDGDSPPPWIRWARIWTTHYEHLVDFSVVPKFCSNRCGSFHKMHVSIFCALGLKKPINAPKWVFWGKFEPLNGENQQVNRTTKRHILARKHVRGRIDRHNRYSTRIVNRILLSIPIHGPPQLLGMLIV